MNIDSAVGVFLKNSEIVKVNKTSVINGGIIEEHDNGTELTVHKLYYFDEDDLEPTGYDFDADSVEAIVNQVNLYQGIDNENTEGVVQSFTKDEISDYLAEIIHIEYESIYGKEDEDDDEEDDYYEGIEGFADLNDPKLLGIVFIIGMICAIAIGVYYDLHYYYLGGSDTSPQKITLPHPEIGLGD